MAQNLQARVCFHGTKDSCVQRFICYDSHSSALIKHITPQQYFKLLTLILLTCRIW